MGGEVSYEVKPKAERKHWGFKDSYAAAKKSASAENARRGKFHKVLHEAKEGTLRTSAGTKPVSRAQELAIAFSEARRAKKK